MRPRPVLTAAGIAGLVTSTAGVLAFLGFAHLATSLSSAAEAIGAVVVGVGIFGSHVAGAAVAQPKVTPLESPRAADGTPLAPVVYVARHAAPEPDLPLDVGIDLTDPAPA